MYCIGCGDDISKIPSKRRSLYSDSVVDPGPRKQARRIQGECATLFYTVLELSKSSGKA